MCFGQRVHIRLGDNYVASKHRGQRTSKFDDDVDSKDDAADHDDLDSLISHPLPCPAILGLFDGPRLRGSVCVGGVLWSVATDSLCTRCGHIN